MKKNTLFIVSLFFCIAFFCNEKPAMAEALVPRTIIALFDSRADGLSNTYIHTMAEMPLNHLGLNVEYHDIHDPLPDIKNRPEVLGVLTWFYSDTKMDSDAYFKWAVDATDAGKKYVIMGPLGVSNEENVLHSVMANKVLERVGVKMLGGWVQNPFDANYSYNTPSMFLGADEFKWTPAPFLLTKAVGKDVKVHLSVHKDGTGQNYASDLIITGPNGGYIGESYIFRTNIRDGDEVSQWKINPFEFFRYAFATDGTPKPDNTTIAGRRIYYSHIDGDGWNNRTQLEEYHEKPVLSSKVILDKAVKPYPDLPVALTLIAADIDPKWVGSEEGRSVAREFFSQPQVEAGTHTYSHPFYWQLFSKGDNRLEVPYLKFYDTPTWKPQLTDADKEFLKTHPFPIPSGYTVPRAYAKEPFDINKEIQGSIDEISPLLPSDKKITILTWPGNCKPWEEPVHLTRVAGIQNVNGGDSRSDPEYPGYASVAPIGAQVGKERQIYASSSNENTYTNEWSENFHAQTYLKKTFYNTETPVRVSPMNIYYHLYTGEREASLQGLISNLDYARAHDVAPLTASHYTHVAEGFYNTKIIALGSNMWRVEDRGALETIRFDRSSGQSVDFENSKGVIGQRYLQGSLYVYLDASVTQPVIAMKAEGHNYEVPESSEQYLVESRWPITNLHRHPNKITFTAQGFGAGEMIWQMPSSGRYTVSAGGKSRTVDVTDDHLLKVTIERNALQPLNVTITEAKS